MNKTQAQSPKILNENELIIKAQSGDEQACRQLLQDNTQMLRARAVYYSPSGECDDFFQEGMFALYSAIQDYNFSSSFSTFARLCVDRRLIGVLRRRNLKKTVPEDKFVSFTDLISSPLDSPEEQLISKEEQVLFGSVFKMSCLHLSTACSKLILIAAQSAKPQSIWVRI